MWRIPGRKRLALDGPDFTLTADLGAQRMRLSLSGAMADGAGYASSAPMTPRLRGQLDVLNAQAHARDIAQALFGLEAVVLRWHEDGELRAQVRHLVRRADAFMNRGYLALAGVPPTAAKHPGDEPVR